MNHFLLPFSLTSFLAFFYSAGSDFQECQVYFSTSVILTAALSRHQSSYAEIPTSLFYLLEALPAPQALAYPCHSQQLLRKLSPCSEIAKILKSDLDLPSLTGGRLVGGSAGWQGRASTVTAHATAPSPEHQAPPWGQRHQLMGQGPTKQERQLGKEGNCSGLSFK